MLAVLAIAGSWVFRPGFVPTADSLMKVEIFHFFYNEFFFHGAIPQWFPYHVLGMPSHYWQMMDLTPMSYVFLVVGRLLHITDVLWVFKCLMMTEQIVFIGGLYLLSQRLFSHRLTPIAICLSGMAAMNWTANIDLNFHIYYLFPWVVYALVLFFDTKRPQYFWLSGIVFLGWMMGNGLYFVFLWAYALLFFTAFLFYQRRECLRALLEKSKSNMLTAAVFFILALAIFYQLKGVTEFAVLLERGEGGKSGLLEFLSYGMTFNATLPQVFQWLVFGHVEFYLGLLPLVVFWLAVRKEKDVYFKSLLVMFIALMVLSFRGIGSTVAYFLPGMSYFRDIGHMYGFIKIVFLLAAGYGLDRLWSMSFKHKTIVLWAAIGIVFFCVDAFGISATWIKQMYTATDQSSMFTFTSQGFRFILYIALAIILLLGMVLKKSMRYANILVMAVFCLDIFSFQYAVAQSNASHRWDASALKTWQVHELTYQPQRLSQPTDTRALNAFLELEHDVKYATLYGFAQFDPCWPQARVDFIPIGIMDMVVLRGGMRNPPDPFFKQNREPDVMRALGCYAPKMRLVHKAIVYERREEVMQLLQQMPGIYDTAIIEGGPLALRLSAQMDQTGNRYEDVIIQKFTTDKLTAKVSAPETGAWLIYADSFHPAWQALVNGQEAPVYKTYLGLKAIYVQGDTTVTLSFYDGVRTWISYGLFCFGLLLSIFIFFVLLESVFIGRIKLA